MNIEDKIDTWAEEAANALKKTGGVMSKNNGGPAFPIVASSLEYIYVSGMTLRDYFAAKAMQGMISRTSWGIEDDAGDIAGEAYGYADAMLAEREKDNEVQN